VPVKILPISTRVVVRSLLVSAVAAALIGLSLLGVKALNTRAYVWKTVQIPLPMEPGRRASAKFVAEVDAVYEVALEFDSVLPEAQMRSLLTVDGDQAAADVSWTVSDGGKTIAAGGSRVLLYYSTGGRTLPGQIKRQVLSIPFHRGRGSFVQIIGRVLGKAGHEYKIVVEQRALDPALRTASPRLGMQLSREFWARHSKGMLTFAHAGLVLIGVSAVLFVAWLGALCMRRWGPNQRVR